MHIITESPPLATAIDVLFALGVEEVRDRREDSTDLLTIKEPTIYTPMCALRVLLLRVLNVHITHQMIS